MAYGKVQETFWDDPLLRELGEPARVLMLYLFTNRHRTRLGLYVLPPSYAAEDLQWTAAKVEKVRRVLEEADRLAYDPNHRCVLVKRFLKHNVLENHKVVTGAMAQLAGLPDTPLLIPLLERVQMFRRAHYVPLIKALENRIANRLEKVDQTVLDMVGDTVAPPNLNLNPIPNPNPNPNPNPSVGDDFERFDEFWSEYPKREGGNPKKAAQKKWDARIREGVSAQDMINGATRYASYVSQTGTEPRYVKQAQTFLGPDEWWNESWHVTPSHHKQERDASDQAVEDFQRRFQGKQPDMRERPAPAPEKVGEVLERMQPTQLEDTNHGES